MADITVITPARSTGLTLVAKVKTEIKVTSSDDDSFISDLIAEASSAISDHLNRDLARCVVSEGLPSYHKNTLMLSRTPVVAVSQVLQQGDNGFDPSTGDVLDSTEYWISNADAGFLFKRTGWRTSEIIGFPAVFSPDVSYLPEQPNTKIWTAQYTGGYLLPGDDVTSSSISAIASDSSFNLVGARLPLLVVGDLVMASGFSNAGNNGTFVVKSCTDTKLVVTGNLIDEAAGQNVSLAVRNLPSSVERAAIETIKGWYFGRDRDWTTKMERIGGTRSGAWTAQYDPSAAFPPLAIQLLERYQRHV